MNSSTLLSPESRAPIYRRAARQVTVLLCTLLVGSGALELHNLGNHHRAIEVGGLIDEAAAHPRIPHHFDRSEELREPACATCALQAQARGVQSATAGALAPAHLQSLDRPTAFSPSLLTLPASASPRGPPAA